MGEHDFGLFAVTLQVTICVELTATANTSYCKALGEGSHPHGQHGGAALEPLAAHVLEPPTIGPGKGQQIPARHLPRRDSNRRHEGCYSHAAKYDAVHRVDPARGEQLIKA